MSTREEKFNELIADNKIIQQALAGEKIDTELYSWLKGDILKLSYMIQMLKKGKTIEETAKFFSVTEAEIQKYIFNNK